jgi:amino acid adenylation domain-containing protein
VLELPTDYPRPAVQSWQGAIESFDIPPDLSAQARELSQANETTLFMTLLAAFQVLLYRYSGQEWINIGTAIANRNRTEIENLIGFFVNTLVIRTDLSGNPGFLELLERVREVTLEAYAHQDLPFEMLVEELQPQRDLSHTPLFQVAFSFQDTVDIAFDLQGVTLQPLEVDTNTAKFDLTLSITDAPEGLRGYFEYNTDLFERETIARMANHFLVLLEGISANPEMPISQLPLLSPAEQAKLLHTWNDTTTPTPTNRCAHHLFEAWADQQPQATALTFQDQTISYAQLDRQANQLAHLLQSLGVRPGTLVGISSDRHPLMVVAILAVMKAGGAYLPLDPTYPEDRLAFMIADAHLPILLTQEHLTEWLPAGDAEIICLDRDWPEIATHPDQRPDSAVTPQHLAYVIYTSGSTGKPKGTLLQHAGLCNLSAAQKQAFRIRPGSRILQFSPLSFDASVWETFMALANGATLCLAPQEVLANGIDLTRLLRNAAITNVTLPPSVLRVLPADDLPDLKTVISAGEACTPDLVARWGPGRRFFNAYGPTETTVCASMFLCDPNDPQPPPIGKPIANTKLYILDANMQPVPVGVPGELHVGGISLARGYLNHPEMTEAKFVPNPFEPGDRLYNSGDLVKFRPDGNIVFLGRIDHQVKVRGFRIELGEIENTLANHPQVREAVLAAREDQPGQQRLVAYIVSETETPPTIGQLRSYLRQSLPEYMLPSAFLFLDAFPLSPSGKVDRQTLPAPEGLRPDLEAEFVAPRNEIEAQLAEIGAQLLGLDCIGVFDNFFSLGGHSLLATQFISRVRESFQVELPLRTLFEHPTIAELAALVEQIQQNDRPEMEKIAALLSQIDGFSDEEIEARLQERQTTD